MAIAQGSVTDFIDITADSCPMTFVKAKLALEKLPGQGVLEILLKGEEPLTNVPKSAQEAGFPVLEHQTNDDGTHTLWIGARSEK